jgi:hypothetical protein
LPDLSLAINAALKMAAYNTATLLRVDMSAVTAIILHATVHAMRSWIYNEFKDAVYGKVVS